MEMSKVNSLCSYLKQKCNFFSFTKLEDERAKQVLSWEGEEKMWGKGVGG
jgi:hypothetical protein